MFPRLCLVIDSAKSQLWQLVPASRIREHCCSLFFFFNALNADYFMFIVGLCFIGLMSANKIGLSVDSIGCCFIA